MPSERLGAVTVPDRPDDRGSRHVLLLAHTTDGAKDGGAGRSGAQAPVTVVDPTT